MLIVTMCFKLFIRFINIFLVFTFLCFNFKMKSEIDTCLYWTDTRKQYVLLGLTYRCESCTWRLAKIACCLLGSISFWKHIFIMKIYGPGIQKSLDTSIPWTVFMFTSFPLIEFTTLTGSTNLYDYLFQLQTQMNRSCWTNL